MASINNVLQINQLHIHNMLQITPHVLSCRLSTWCEVMSLIFYIFWKQINNMPTVLDLNSSPTW